MTPEPEPEPETETELVTEIDVTDDRGQKHTLQCQHGIDVWYESDGELVAVAKWPDGRKSALRIASGRWLAMRMKVA